MSALLIYKALHIFFMVAWFAGIFYLPRLFIYHTMTEEKACTAMLKIMERRLLYFVTPFAVLTTVFGVLTIMEYGREWFKYNMWLHYKLVFVIILYIYHAYCFKLLADFKHDRNIRSTRFYRFFNEFPVFLLLPIILLAVLKPLF
ncbi:CopD family protein [Pseudoalteromonas luteoviolacea]|uniref:Protoporphyrinogen IX oxidase n=1 Tax=Pseudoalteromonas luteoviolacea H33 TaxID=1365251 RepID=A0A167G4Q9_9GAMM|nr:CopD family protein [Pseudoalteromonas luteoviolacea]KZN54102.1 membrane protein [Pseudoalteromonas luteoviolacea H33]KZN78367.1 membrane protein [Pseudoalteromonas luteoviolacea H33-S]MBQ4877385.1 CopD family protein [Pseudoalteromonas luteoviolacea]MBQ4906516.1 CopD family protein [Pseudoalteromonas luteoviolacea]MCF6438313.1 CopD family protein [Pseudoalteromonas luteoviolacea]